MMRVAPVFSKLKRPLAGVALLLLAGCAGGQAADVQDAAAAEDVAVKSAASDESFTAVGKSTKTIETPWGPRQVYDPSRDQIFRSIYRKWYDTEFKSIDTMPVKPAYPNTHYLAGSSSSYFNRAIRITQLDYMRHGCTSLVSSMCYWATNVFSKDCGADSNFGSIILSECENKSFTPLNMAESGPGLCEFKNNRLHPANAYKNASSFEESISIYTEWECSRWRGEDGADYWKNYLPDRNALPR